MEIINSIGNVTKVFSKTFEPEARENEIIKHAPSGGTVSVIDMRHVKGRWDDCLIVFKKD